MSHQQRFSLELSYQRDLRGSGLESLSGQPVMMALCPFRVSSIVESVAEDPRVDPLPGMREINDGPLPGPEDIPQAFLFDWWDADFGDFAEREHPGQCQGVSLVSLDPVAWSSKQFRWGRDRARDSLLREVAGEPVPGGAGFVGAFGVVAVALHLRDHSGIIGWHRCLLDFTGISVE